MDFSTVGSYLTGVSVVPLFTPWSCISHEIRCLLSLAHFSMLNGFTLPQPPSIVRRTVVIFSYWLSKEMHGYDVDIETPFQSLLLLLQANRPYIFLIYIIPLSQVHSLTILFIDVENFNRV